MLRIARVDRYALVVCGGGPAGIASALSAARKGVPTALIERQGCLGGTVTAAGVNQMLGGRKLDEKTKEHVRVIGGIFDEITDRLIEQGKAIEPNSIDLDFNPFGWYPRMASGIVLDETAFKILLDEMMYQAGVRVYYETELIDTVRSGRKIEAVLVHNKDGLIRVEADYFADCTGDADLCEQAGLACLKGRAGDGLMTPASLIMHVENVDGDALVRYQNEHRSPKLAEIIDGLRQKGLWPFPYGLFIAGQLMDKDVFMINTIRQVGVDGTSEESVSRALAKGRAESVQLFELFKAHMPGFRNARIKRVYDHVGIRETRRIQGRATVTTADALAGRRYDDCVAATTYNFDLPDPIRPSFDPMMGDSANPNPKRKHIVIRIPYGCLLPDEADNLIAAGRCVSVEREVLGPVRIMGPTMMMGQAAGTAVAQALETHCALFDVDTDILRQTLFTDGVIDPDTLPFS